MEGENNFEELLTAIDIELSKIANEKVKVGFFRLFNIIDDLTQENKELRERNRNLVDEINRLKGGKREHDKSKPKPKKNKDVSSEKERKSRKPKKQRKKKSKNGSLKIDETCICPLDKSSLPEDVIYKGTESVIVQELNIERHVIEFKKEIFYSKQENKTYVAPLPAGFHGAFGPQLRSLIIALHYAINVSEPKILELLNDFGIQISEGTISNILIQDTPENKNFLNEKDDIYEEGLKSGKYQQIDDTGVNVNGENRHAQVVCNPYYTAYFTTEKKDRLTIIDVLRNFKERHFVFSDLTVTLLEGFHISEKIIEWLSKNMIKNKEYTEKEISPILDCFESVNQRRKIYEVLYISASHMEKDFAEIILSDDAKQFKKITNQQALCWIHDGRLYKKLEPVTPYNKKRLKSFLEKYWDYYQKLVDYKNNPNKKRAEELAAEFDSIFRTETGYQALDKRIKSTYEKKENLLISLQHPEIPLHNNESELAVRTIKRWEDVSLFTRTEKGTKNRDALLTIIATAKKLGVNALKYIIDRINGKFKRPSLATLIKAKTSMS